MTRPVLAVEGVCKAFGALRVLSDISFDVREGETLGLIGPNGAGKTTLFNVLTGFLHADSGSVRYLGNDITGVHPRRRVRDGLVRTFQKSVIFPELSVRENIALAARGAAGTGCRWWGSAAALQAADRHAEELVRRAGLGHRCDVQVKTLSYGEQRIADVLVSLALAPRVLLLDEPTAGLAKAEAERLFEIIRHHDERASVILIAHDLDIVFGTCDRIAVLNLGELLAVDTPHAIRAHEGVRAAYLGSEVVQ